MRSTTERGTARPLGSQSPANTVLTPVPSRAYSCAAKWTNVLLDWPRHEYSPTPHAEVTGSSTPASESLSTHTSTRRACEAHRSRR